MREEYELLIAAFGRMGMARECWLVHGTTSTGAPFCSRKFVGSPRGFRTANQAKEAAEHHVELAKQYGGSMVSVHQFLNAATMLWEDAE